MKYTKKKQLLPGDVPGRSGGATPASGGLLTDSHQQEADALAALEEAQLRYQDREPFSYDLSADPFYQQYKEQYSHLGELAMEDTVGKVATLTGGYGNSYAQTAGQQTYEAYLQQLGQIVPELYGDAYERYMAEGEALYRDVLLQQQAYDRAVAQSQSQYERLRDQLSWQEQQTQQLLQQQRDSYDRLTTLILQGYVPSDDELSQAGMTRQQADALGSYSTTGGGGSGGSGGSGQKPDGTDFSKEDIKLLQQTINAQTGSDLAVDGIWGNLSSQAAGDLSLQEAWDKFITQASTTEQPRNWAHVENDLKQMKEKGESMKKIQRFLAEELKNGTINVTQYNELYLKYCV